MKSSTPSGQRMDGKPDRREYYKAYKEANREKIAEQQRIRRAKNKEQTSAYFKAWYAKNREREIERVRAYYTEHRETILQKEAKRRALEGEAARAKRRERRAANRERDLARRRESSRRQRELTAQVAKIENSRRWAMICAEIIVHGHSLEAVAERFGVSPKTLDTRLSQYRRALREASRESRQEAG